MRLHEWDENFWKIYETGVESIELTLTTLFITFIMVRNWLEID